MGLKPLAVGGSINLDDGALDEGLCADELVVGRVVDNVHNAGLLGNRLGSPDKVASVKTHGAVLDVSTADTDSVDTLGANLGAGSLLNKRTGEKN